MTNALVQYAVSDGVATLILDSPHNRNALSRRLVSELFEGFDRAEADDDVRVVVLTASGSVFCSGADLAEASDDGMEDGARRIVDLQRRIVGSDKPVVARVQGAVRAGGTGVVAAADIAICADDVTFALTEVRLGLAAAVISLTVLPRLTSRAAARTFLTGETFDAGAAAAMGLVTTAVPQEQLDDEVGRVVDDLRKGHPQGLRESKRLVNAELLARIDESGADVADLSARLFGSEDAREAMAAFLARRQER
ncbi:MAG: Methylglutaconyl-CoA hydratase [uncultured Nocardioidaceae bacterium]|uniref:Methylglutaconyl-CoA hydratase n=1 Tax=uncultured Nocardioidaceae bacterium TaxID=253824 RepID=A0A6J4L5B7_9ACTN|nr:MAG: Methylglutaconyl-CoA hydratase [uncultured Nocardioidaceae bacterium]